MISEFMYALGRAFKNIRIFHVIIVVLIGVPSAMYVVDTFDRWAEEDRIEEEKRRKEREAYLQKQREQREQAQRKADEKERQTKLLVKEKTIVSMGSKSILSSGISMSSAKVDYNTFKSWVEPYYETKYENGRSVSRKQGGYYKKVDNGAKVTFSLTNLLKNYSVTVKGSYSFKTKSTKVKQKGCEASYLGKSFSGTFSEKLAPGETKQITLVKDTSTRGRFVGLCLYLGPVPKYDPNLDFKSVSVRTTSASAQLEK